LIDIKQLKYFLTIVEEGQITRAAKKLHMAQPPLSQQLKQLEETLGVILLERNGRKLELTEAGKILYQKAKHLLQQLDETILEVKETDHGMRGVLSIGCVKSCFSYIPKTIRLFQQTFPNVKFHIREGDTFLISEFLKNREIEIGIVRLPINSEDYEIIQLPSDPFVAVMPKNWNDVGHPIQMKDMKDIPLLLLHRISGKGQYEIVVNECKRHGFEPNIVCECPDVTILLSLVAAGVGATIVPKSAVTLFQIPEITVLEIADSSIKAEAAIIFEKNRYLSKSAVHFLDMLKSDFFVNNKHSSY
jgi:LysR family transcriptional regulator, salicylic acid-responsive activator of bsdBCD